MSELAIEYGELEDALGWIVESPFRERTDERGEDILIAAARSLEVDQESLDEFLTLGWTRVLVGNYGLDAPIVDHLLGNNARKLSILVGIASARGKVPGP